MKTKFTEMMGIRLPIMQGGMQWVGRAELTSAVSNADGLGTLTALTQKDPEALSLEIGRCQTLTNKPFAVNLTVLPTINPPPYREYAEAIVSAGVPIVETAGNVPPHIMSLFKSAGIKIIHKCTQVRHAIAAERRGVDVVSVDGFECAGHPGEKDVPNFLLVPLVVDALKIPTIVSGGIGDGRGLAAALSMGAAGVNMGTRFVATKEAPVHENIKQAFVDADVYSTNLIFRTLNNTARVLQNDVSNEVVAMEHQPGGCSFDDIRHLVAGTRGRKALESGKPDEGVITAGPVMGLINDIPSCAELLQRMADQACELIEKAQAAVK